MTDVGKKDNIQNSVKVYDGTSRVERGEVRQVVQSYTQHAQAIAVFMSEFICPNEKRKKESIDQKLEEIQKENNDLNNKTQIDALKEQLARFKYGSKKYMNALQNISNGFLDTLNFDLQVGRKSNFYYSNVVNSNYLERCIEMQKNAATNFYIYMDTINDEGHITYI